MTYITHNSSNAIIKRQTIRYSKDFADSILKHITLIQNTLEKVN